MCQVVDRHWRDKTNPEKHECCPQDVQSNKEKERKTTKEKTRNLSREQTVKVWVARSHDNYKVECNKQSLEQ